jgi:hypothetical protein
MHDLCHQRALARAGVAADVHGGRSAVQQLPAQVPADHLAVVLAAGQAHRHVGQLQGIDGPQQHPAAAAGVSISIRARQLP